MAYAVLFVCAIVAVSSAIVARHFFGEAKRVDNEQERLRAQEAYCGSLLFLIVAIVGIVVALAALFVI